MGCAAKKPSKEVQRTEKMIVANYSNQEKGSTVEFHYIEEKSIQEYIFFKEQAIGKEIAEEEKKKLMNTLKEAIQPAYFVACKNEKGEWEGVVNLYILNTYKEMIGLLTDVLIDPKIGELTKKVFKGKLIVRAAISLAFEAYNCDRVIFDGEESLFQALTDFGKNKELGINQSSITLETYNEKKRDDTFSSITVPLAQEEEGSNISSALLYPFKKVGETMVFVGKSAVSVGKSAAETVVHAGETVIVNPLKTAGKAVVDTGDRFLVSPISNAISGKRDKENKEDNKENKEDKEDNKEKKENKEDKELEEQDKIKTEEHVVETHTREQIEVNEIKKNNEDDAKLEENDEKLKEKEAKLNEEQPLENREEKVEEGEEGHEKKENQQ